MTWSVVSPLAVVTQKAVIVTVDVPFFTDAIEYEEILGRAFSSPTDRDRLASGLVIVLATLEAKSALAEIIEGVADVPVEETLMRLALSRQIVVLRWALLS